MDREVHHHHHQLPSVVFVWDMRHSGMDEEFLVPKKKKKEEEWVGNASSKSQGSAYASVMTSPISSPPLPPRFTEQQQYQPMPP